MVFPGCQGVEKVFSTNVLPFPVLFGMSWLEGLAGLFGGDVSAAATWWSGLPWAARQHVLENHSQPASRLVTQPARPGRKADQPRPAGLPETMGFQLLVAVSQVRSGRLTGGPKVGGHGVGWLADRWFTPAEQPGLSWPQPADESGVVVSPVGVAEEWLVNMARELDRAGWRPMPASVLAGRLGCSSAQAREGKRLISAAIGVQQAGGSWAPPPPDGVYSRIPAWWGRQGWLREVDLLLDTPAGRKARQARQVAAATIRAVAREDARAADRKTGRDVLTSDKTVGVKIGRRYRQVQAARSWLTLVGLQKVIQAGRYLTVGERRQAAAFHGGQQTRVASRRCCTNFTGWADDNFRRLSTTLISPSTFLRLQVLPRRTRKRVTPGTRRETSLAARRYAAHLAWWCRPGPDGTPERGSLNRLAAALQRMGVLARFATPEALLDALDASRTPGSQTWFDPRQIRDPLGYHLGRVKRLLAARPDPALLSAAPSPDDTPAHIPPPAPVLPPPVSPAPARPPTKPKETTMSTTPLDEPPARTPPDRPPGEIHDRAWLKARLAQQLQVFDQTQARQAAGDADRAAAEMETRRAAWAAEVTATRRLLADYETALKRRDQHLADTRRHTSETPQEEQS